MEKELIEKIRKGDEEVFGELFRTWYSDLCLFANQYVGSADLSRDVVQEVFIRIWDNRENFNINSSVKAYLYKAVKNQAISQLRKTKPSTDISEALNTKSDLYEMEEILSYRDEPLTNQIWKEVRELPERKRTIFTLYRKHGLSYKEIAEVMGITRKTVENQMGRALLFLRERLQKVYLSD
ncbi:MAG: RNA polymerase sigma-70 factor [Balneolaceae bacterium]|nr:RNA polymerase sigma-70 factor [Balneolaceae bacterium]